MRSCFSKDSKLTIIDEIKTIVKIIDEVPLGDVFNYLIPNSYNTYMIDTKYNVPLIEINFDGWFETSVRLWPKSKKARSKFILLERTPPRTPSVSSFSSIDDSGNDTVF